MIDLIYFCERITKPRFRENRVENFRENCSKIAKFFFENERTFSRNFRENRVSRFSLETLAAASVSNNRTFIFDTFVEFPLNLKVFITKMQKIVCV